jgi:UDP-N-acetylglucosamine 2-epimerase (non-hydrolysing)
VANIARDLPVVFAVHPRTRQVLGRSDVATGLVETGRLRLLDPLGYLEFLGLMDASALVLTDSGGIQEETTILGVPCLTLREQTERPVTVTHGTNRIVGTDPDRILEGWHAVRGAGRMSATPPLWDGQAAERIVDVLERVATPALTALTEG